MTVESLTRRKLQTADGLNDTFTFDFLVTDADHLIAYHNSDLSTPLSKTLVTGVGNQAGGTVQLAAIPPAGTIVLVREIPFTQTYSYTTGGKFPAKTHEQLADNVMMAVQQLKDETGRSVKLPLDATATDLEMPNPSTGRTIIGKTDESGWEDGPTATEISNAQTYANDANTAKTAAQAAQAGAELAETGAQTAQAAAELAETGAETAETNAALSAASVARVPARNAVQNQEPLSQGESTRSGMESLLGTNTSGVDITTGDFGGMRWTKDRNNVASHILSDSVRGDFYLSSDTTAAEVATVPAIDADDVTWTFQTTKKTTGTTNRNKAYTCHYNPDMNFSIVGYEGDGVDGHEIPHHLPVVPELTIIKNRDQADTWVVQSSMFDLSDYLILNTTAALANTGTRDTIFSSSTVKVDSGDSENGSAENLIMYNFASKSGVCKVGKYIGTGAAGNYVSTEVDGGDAFKPAFVMFKSLTGVEPWIIVDSMRSDNYLLADSSAAEAAFDHLDFNDNGFSMSSGTNNVLNSEYLFIAFAETSIDASKAVTNYPYATAADTLSIAQDTLISVANGFNANGEINTQFQFGAGVTETFGVGHEDKHYYMYSDKTGTLGVSESRPLVGLTRGYENAENEGADKYGEVSPTDALALDNRSRTTSKHFDYESDSGVALASGEVSTEEVYNAFNKDSNGLSTSKWSVLSTTTSTIQYKHTEKRILKSYRLRASDDADTIPRQFTVEGSNDGLNWTAIDSTYTASDFTDPGVGLWSAIQDTTANTTAYLYHRLNITLNHGDGAATEIAELEFNTVLESDYYLVKEGQMYNSSDVAIERTYLGDFKTDADGDVIKESIINATPAKQQITEAEVHGNLTVHGDINHENAITVRGYIDTHQNPPLILSSKGIAGVVDLGTGALDIIFSDEMDNLDFHVLNGGEYDGALANSACIQVEAHANRTKNRIRLLLLDYAGNTDDGIVSFAIIGGKS